MSNVILFVFEGKNPELSIFGNIENNFSSYFSGRRICTIYDADFYQLWSEIRDNSFEDIVSILRRAFPSNKEKLQNIEYEDVSDTFLFFDSDLHADDTSFDCKVALKEAFHMFGDGEDNIHLYLSYPMVEAVKSCYPQKEKCFDPCVWEIDKGTEFKGHLGDRNHFADFRVNKFGLDKWFYLIEINYEKACCLLYGSDVIPQTISEARRISQQEIYNRQFDYFILKRSAVVILSAFPFFIIDFFNNETLSEQYNVMVKNFKPKEDCGFYHILEQVKS